MQRNRKVIMKIHLISTFDFGKPFFLIFNIGAQIEFFFFRFVRDYQNFIGVYC